MLPVQHFKPRLPAYEVAKKNAVNSHLVRSATVPNPSSSSQRVRGRNVRVLPPSTKLQRIPSFSQISSGLNINANSSKHHSNKLIDSIHKSRTLSKAEIAYSLIEYQTLQLSRITEKSKSILDPVEREKYFSENMEKLGFKAVNIDIKDGDEKYQLRAWTQPSRSFLVHTCPFWLVNQKVSSPLANPALRDENYILRSNKKLCASVVKAEDASIFQAHSRAGLIMRVPVDSILDTYPSDRLSPVGFRRSKQEVDSMSLDQKTAYESQLNSVDNFVDLLAKYRALTAYFHHVGDALVNIILSEVDELTKDERAMLENFLVGIDPHTKEALENPKTTEFEERPALLRYVNQLHEIYSKYGSKLNLNEMIFNDKKVDFENELNEMNLFVREMLVESKEWGSVNIHPAASKWEKAIREDKEVFAARLMPASIHGPTALNNIKKEENRFVELNVATDNVDIAGFLIDQLHFMQSDNSSNFNLDLNESRKIIDVIVRPDSEELNKLKGEINQVEKNSEEYQGIRDQIKLLEERIAPYERMKHCEELLNLLKFSFYNSIPFIISGE